MGVKANEVPHRWKITKLITEAAGDSASCPRFATGKGTTRSFDRALDGAPLRKTGTVGCPSNIEGERSAASTFLAFGGGF